MKKKTNKKNVAEILKVLHNSQRHNPNCPCNYNNCYAHLSCSDN